MAGTLYVIGTGPGDPELLTVKAVRILKEVPVICVPKGREKGRSLALSIASGIVDLKDREIMEAHFPMVKTRTGRTAQTQENRNKTADGRQESGGRGDDLEGKWNETIERLTEQLSGGRDVAFITLGDPTIYSTFYYLHEKLRISIPDLNIIIVPGISSINASAAAAGMSLSLADEKIAVLPATYEDNLEGIFETFDTVVLMKVHRVFDRVRDMLGKLDIMDRAVYVCRAGMKDQKVFHDINEVRGDDLNYFSILIVKK